jgi:hypothetical protein
MSDVTWDNMVPKLLERLPELEEPYKGHLAWWETKNHPVTFSRGRPL